jgi:hypothetical protein
MKSLSFEGGCWALQADKSMVLWVHRFVSEIALLLCWGDVR